MHVYLYYLSAVYSTLCTIPKTRRNHGVGSHNSSNMSNAFQANYQRRMEEIAAQDGARRVLGLDKGEKRPCPYTVLGVHPGVTQKEAHTAYKRLAMKFHPDRNVGATEPEKRIHKAAFQFGKDAWEDLKEPETKKNSDSNGRFSQESGYSQARQRGRETNSQESWREEDTEAGGSEDDNIDGGRWEEEESDDRAYDECGGGNYSDSSSGGGGDNSTNGGGDDECEPRRELWRSLLHPTATHNAHPALSHLDLQTPRAPLHVGSQATNCASSVHTLP